VRPASAPARRSSARIPATRANAPRPARPVRRQSRRRFPSSPELSHGGDPTAAPFDHVVKRRRPRYGPRYPERKEAPMARLRFGYFIAPFHRSGTNPTLALQRDLEFAEHLDALGFDEVWYGEHPS